MGKTSRLWPYTRAIAKAITIPGTKIGPGILTDIQDQLSADDFQREVTDALSAIRADARSAVKQLQKEGINVAAEVLADAIRPREDDSDKVSTLRELVFQWVWNAAQYADR